MGVRGTEFICDVPPNQPGQAAQPAKITVLEGVVEVEPAAPQLAQSSSSARAAPSSAKVTLTAGQQLTASANAPLPTKALTLDSSALGKISASAKIADNTFTRAVVMDLVSSTTSSSTSSLSNGSGSRTPAGASSTSSSSGSAAGSAGSAAGSAGGVSSVGSTAGATTISEITTVVAPTAAAPPPPAPPLLGGGVIPGSGAGDPGATLHPVSTNVPTGSVVLNPVTVIIH
jgi:hypothetical protein